MIEILDIAWKDQEINFQPTTIPKKLGGRAKNLNSTKFGKATSKFFR